MDDIEFKRLLSLWADAIQAQATEENLKSFVTTAALQADEAMRFYRHADAAIKRAKPLGIRADLNDKKLRALATQQLQVLVPALNYARLALSQLQGSREQRALSLLISHVVYHALRLPDAFGTTSPASYSTGTTCHRTVQNAVTARTLAQHDLLKLPAECHAVFDKKFKPYEARVVLHAYNAISKDKLALRKKILAAVTLDERELALLNRFL